MAKAWEARANGTVEGDRDPDEVERQGEREDDGEAHDNTPRAESMWSNESDLWRWRCWICFEDGGGMPILPRRLLLIFGIDFLVLLPVVLMVSFLKLGFTPA